MKRDKELADIRELTIPELEKRLDDLRRGLFKLKINAATAHIKDYSTFGKVRKSIARVLTELRAKNLDSGGSAG